MNFTCDHIHLRSLDPEKAAQFYAEMFGATVRSRSLHGEALRVVVDLGGLQLFIEQVPPQTPVPPPPPFVGIEHVGLRVENLDAVVADLRGKGGRFLVEPNSSRPGLKLAFIEGPDGVRIELLERSSL
jgi:catechol 2,3-dioxygenase-like lactoylglutathione lyase family enzyme